MMSAAIIISIASDMSFSYDLSLGAISRNVKVCSSCSFIRYSMLCSVTEFGPFGLPFITRMLI